MTMNWITISRYGLVALIVSGVVCVAPAEAQIDRDRTVERSETIMDEDARFLRDSREAGDFVGRRSSDEGGIVGARSSGEARETVRSAVDDNLQIDLGTDINQTNVPLMPPQFQLNAPRLKAGFLPRVRAGSEIDARLINRLRTRLPGDATNPIEVSVGEGEVLLRGEVASERDRRMAELLVGFEPGVRQVRNELQVAPTSTPQEPATP